MRKIKRFIHKKVLDYVNKREGLQADVVANWAGNNEIAQYNIEDSEVTLSNVNMIYSSIVGCTVKEMRNNKLDNCGIAFVREGVDEE